jgi:hypothetical protein
MPGSRAKKKSALRGVIVSKAKGHRRVCVLDSLAPEDAGGAEDTGGADDPGRAVPALQDVTAASEGKEDAAPGAVFVFKALLVSRPDKRVFAVFTERGALDVSGATFSPVLAKAVWCGDMLLLNAELDPDGDLRLGLDALATLPKTHWERWRRHNGSGDAELVWPAGSPDAARVDDAPTLDALDTIVCDLVLARHPSRRPHEATPALEGSDDNDDALDATLSASGTASESDVSISDEGLEASDLDLSVSDDDLNDDMDLDGDDTDVLSAGGASMSSAMEF